MKKNTRRRLHHEDRNPSPRGKTLADFATKISAAWQGSIDSGIEAGRLWIELQNTLSAEQQARVKSITKLSDAHVSMLIGIAEESMVPKPKGQAISHEKSVAGFSMKIVATMRLCIDSQIEAGRLWTEAKKTLSDSDLTELKAKTGHSDARISGLIDVAEHASRFDKQGPGVSQ